MEKINNKSDYEFGIESFLDESFQNKKSKDEADVVRAGGRVVPLVLSSTGVWHGESLRELRSLAKYVSVRRGITENESWKLFLVELNCSLARGNTIVLTDARNKFKIGAIDDEVTESDGGVWPDRDFD